MVCSLLLFFGCSEKHDWKELVKFEGGVAYYLTSKYDSRNNSEPLSGSVRWVYEQPQSLRINNSIEIIYTSKEATILLNCKELAFSMPDYSFLNKSEVAHWVSEKPEEIKWQSLKSNNIIAMLAEKLDKSCAPL